MEAPAPLRQLGEADRAGLVGVQQALVGPRDTIAPGAKLLVGGAVPRRAALGCGREAVELRHHSIRAGQQLCDMPPHGGLDLLGLDVSARASCGPGAHDAVLAVAHVIASLRLASPRDVRAAEHGQPTA
jgi:hypothetical protein